MKNSRSEDQKRVAKKEFLTKHPSSLIHIPKNRELFTQAELEQLLVVAEKPWIESEGKLLDDNVSLLK